MGVIQIDNTQTINNATWRVQPDVITSESGIVKENGTIHYIDGKLKYHADGSIKELGVGTDYATPVSGVITSLPGAFAFENINYLYAAGGIVFFNGDSWEYALTNANATVGTLVTDVSSNKTYRWSGASWLEYASQKVLDLSLSRKTNDYTLTAADNGQVVEMNKATANTLTVPNSVFSAGQQVLITQYGAGQTTIAAGAGVTLRSSEGKLKFTNQYATATLIFISASEAYVSGNLTA
jgi:hypothetical protein